MCYVGPREGCTDLCFCVGNSDLADAQIKLFLCGPVRVEAWKGRSGALQIPAEDLPYVVPKSHFENKEKILWRVFHFHKKRWIFAKYLSAEVVLRLK